MKRDVHKRGSVLMELIIVMPVYMVLLAGTFLIGDSLLFGTELAHWERVLAHGNPTGAETGAKIRRHYADTVVQGAWTERRDVKKTGYYRLPDYGLAGMFLFGGQTSGGSGMSDADFSALKNGGSVSLFSKDNASSRPFKFNIYTLRRNRDVGMTGGRSSWRDNARHPSQLLCNRDSRGEIWRRHVADELWHGSVDEGGQGNVSGAFPLNLASADRYVRYGRFAELLGER